MDGRDEPYVPSLVSLEGDRGGQVTAEAETGRRCQEWACGHHQAGRSASPGAARGRVLGHRTSDSEL